MEEKNEANQLYTINQAQFIKRDYVCATCWGHLSIQNVKGEQRVKVTCLVCGDDRGLVTKSYVDRRLAESQAEAIEARDNLSAVMPWLKGAKRTNDEILTDLGFGR